MVHCVVYHSFLLLWSYEVYRYPEASGRVAGKALQ